MVDINQAEDFLRKLFFKSSDSDYENIQGKEFAHYTSIDKLFKILSDPKRLLLRNTSCMNDVSEIKHGLYIIKELLSESPRANRVKSFFSDIGAPIVKEINILFESYFNYFFYDTYIACFSEHNQCEKQYGRLSMWREYARNNGAALIVSSDILQSNPTLPLILSKVEYLDRTGIQRQLDAIINTMEENKLHLADLTAFFKEKNEDEEVLKNFLHALSWACLCVKHPVFSEEKEWRIIYSSGLSVPHVYKIETEAICINGQPQMVSWAPLGVSISQDKQISAYDLIKQIIVGPTENPEATYKALIKKLHDIGRADAAKLITVPRIPLRM